MLRDESVGFEATWCGVARDAAREAKHEAGHEATCERLHRRLKRIGKARAALDAQEAEALREAERLRMWRHYGYGSLIEYMEMELGYPPRAALERLRVAKAIVDLPAIEAAMAQGDLSFSAGRELVRVATPETEGEWLEAASDKNVRDVEAMVSGHKRGDTPTDPVDPALRTRTLRFDDIDDETRALQRQARQILDRERGERVSDCDLLRTFARMVIDGAASPPRTRAPYQVAVTVCEQCKRGWQDGGGVTVPMSPATLEVALCDAMHIGSVATPETGAVQAKPRTKSDTVPSTSLAKSDTAPSASLAKSDTALSTPRVKSDAAPSMPRAKSDVAPAGVRAKSDIAPATPRVKSDAAPSMPRAKSDDAPAGVRAKSDIAPATPRAKSDVAPAGARAKSDIASASARAKSDIPPALRRKVLARDHGRCRVPWCRSSRNIDQHHLLARSEGGEHALENLITLCESHHIAHHQGALIIEGSAESATFTRRAHSAFALAERAVETASALKSLGFDRPEVRLAMERTRAHVGTAELSLEQWTRSRSRSVPSRRSNRCRAEHENARTHMGTTELSRAMLPYRARTA